MTSPIGLQQGKEESAAREHLRQTARRGLLGPRPHSLPYPAYAGVPPGFAPVPWVGMAALVHQADILCSRVRKRKIVRERYICIDWDSLHAPMGLISPIVDEKPNL